MRKPDNMEQFIDIVDSTRHDTAHFQKLLVQTSTDLCPLIQRRVKDGYIADVIRFRNSTPFTTVCGAGNSNQFVELCCAKQQCLFALGNTVPKNEEGPVAL